MDNVKEPLIPDIKPSQDDIEMRQRQTKPRRTSPAKADSKPSGSSGLAVVAVLLALAALGGGAYLFKMLQAQQYELLEARQIIEEQSSNLKLLNERLSATGENASLSLDALKVLLKEHDSEIRKLWDVANKRNKGLIASNEKAIAASIASLKALQSRIETSLTEQQTLLEQQQLASSALSERVSANEAGLLSLPESELRIAQNSEAVQMASRNVASLKTSLASRQQEIDSLRKQLRQVELRITTLHAPAATK
ncbi:MULTISPECIES: hypothetical protein [unclassified Oceanobacter]|uniref:hypothetical protein n=1 Tax=unclassified Oceanobacter TaxID=2620260 RepID=UPI002732BACB|nr:MULTISPECIES: hypothetical protein [unclassified Oceanobacter]MDP2505719.1 hypothetical protein [Oceanobacter sp. 3_MG-2023]MDP2608242.1 hypothetical protein [Oceanobacter sp. 1_MG-2023]MDP2612127.1 hypothetical protein [Oceanobacter sp. 2_MG-2023]